MRELDARRDAVRPLITSPLELDWIAALASTTVTAHSATTRASRRKSAPARGGEQRLEQVAAQARQQRLRLGSPKRTLNSITRGPSAVSISPP